MPNYTLPDFNLSASLWVGPTVPLGNPADYVSIPCQKYIISRAGGFGGINWNFSADPPVQLRFPRVAPFNVSWNNWHVTWIEVPEGSGQFYCAYFYDIMHEGFVNEYAVLYCNQTNEDGSNYAPAYSDSFLHNPTKLP